MDKNTVKQITEISKWRNEDAEAGNWNWRNAMWNTSLKSKKNKILKF